jgi:hypothetical protein
MYRSASGVKHREGDLRMCLPHPRLERRRHQVNYFANLRQDIEDLPGDALSAIGGVQRAREPVVADPLERAPARRGEHAAPTPPTQARPRFQVARTCSAIR